MLSALWEHTGSRANGTPNSNRASAEDAVDSSFSKGESPLCDQAWFTETYLGGSAMAQSMNLTGGIWQYVTSLPMARPLTLLAAHAGALETFFEVETKHVNGVEHLVVGHGVGCVQENAGVREVSELRAFLMDAVRFALISSRDLAMNPQTPSAR